MKLFPHMLIALNSSHSLIRWRLRHFRIHSSVVISFLNVDFYCSKMHLLVNSIFLCLWYFFNSRYSGTELTGKVLLLNADVTICYSSHTVLCIQQNLMLFPQPREKHQLAIQLNIHIDSFNCIVLLKYVVQTIILHTSCCLNSEI